MTPAQREKVLAAIKRITNGVAEAAGIPAERAPIIEIAKDNVPSTINDPALTQRVAVALEKSLGKENVWPGQPIMPARISACSRWKPEAADYDVLAGGSGSRQVEKKRRKKGRGCWAALERVAPLPEPAIRTV